MVLAQTQAQADAAADLITALYSNQQAPILDIPTALANPQRGIYNYTMPPVVLGDVVTALASSPNKIQVSASDLLW